jgi:hypothetical protein
VILVSFLAIENLIYYKKFMKIASIGWKFYCEYSLMDHNLSVLVLKWINFGWFHQRLIRIPCICLPSTLLLEFQRVMVCVCISDSGRVKMSIKLYEYVWQNTLMAWYYFQKNLTS